MRIRITGGGIYGTEGEIPVGTELDLKAEPTGWAGRYEVVSKASKDAVPIVNPADDLDEITGLREEYEKLTGEEADKRWKEDTLRKKIADSKKAD